MFLGRACLIALLDFAIDRLTTKLPARRFQSSSSARQLLSPSRRQPPRGVVVLFRGGRWTLLATRWPLESWSVSSTRAVARRRRRRRPPLRGVVVVVGQEEEDEGTGQGGITPRAPSAPGTFDSSTRAGKPRSSPHWRLVGSACLLDCLYYDAGVIGCF